MTNSEPSFNILESIQRHIEALIPLLPKQAIVCIGEYPIKTFLKQSTLGRDGLLPIFIEKSSDDIYKWIPKGYNAHFVLGFEDMGIDTHFWYDVSPIMEKDTSVIDSLNKKSTERLRSAIVFSSVWDGVGSAALQPLIRKFEKQNIDSLSIAVLPSKIQPADAHFNAYATLQMCLATEGSTVLLLGRDELETFEGIDRNGIQIKGNAVVNYLLDLLLVKESLVQEIAELSRTFNVKFFSTVTVTAASYRVYGSLKNMLNAAVLKQLLTFDLSSASLLYVLLRMPNTLKDKIPRAKIELEITNWFKERTNPQSIHISEPIYTDDMSDRIDAVLFIGGFDTTKMFADWDRKVSELKSRAVEKGYMTDDWRSLIKVREKPKAPETVATPGVSETISAVDLQQIDEQKVANEATSVEITPVPINIEVAVEANTVGLSKLADVEAPTIRANAEKPKRSRRKRAEVLQAQPPTSKPSEASKSEKPIKTRRTRKAQMP